MIISAWACMFPFISHMKHLCYRICQLASQLQISIKCAISLFLIWFEYHCVTDICNSRLYLLSWFTVKRQALRWSMSSVWPDGPGKPMLILHRVITMPSHCNHPVRLPLYSGPVKGIVSLLSNHIYLPTDVKCCSLFETAEDFCILLKKTNLAILCSLILTYFHEFF